MPRLVIRVATGSAVTLTFLAMAIPSLVVGAAGDSSPTPVVPPTQRQGGVCTVLDSPPGATSPRNTPLTLPKHPSGGDIVWLPGLNSTTCNAVLTRADAKVAAALARDIDQAPVLSSTVSYSCPADDETRARIVFTFAHRASQTVSAQLSGCSWIVAVGHAMRSSTPSSAGTWRQSHRARGGRMLGPTPTHQAEAFDLTVAANRYGRFSMMATSSSRRSP